MAAHRSFPPSWYQASGLEGLWSVDSVDGIQVGNGIELEAVGLKFEPYRWAAVAPLWCDRDLGFFPNSSGNKAAENLRPITGPVITLVTSQHPRRQQTRISITWPHYDIKSLRG